MIRLANLIVLLYNLSYVTLSEKNDYAEYLRAMEAKIVGGMPVMIEEFPYNVQFFNDGSMCAGSILTNRAVLTAAHCFDANKNKEDMTIFAEARYVFDYDAMLYDVFGFYIHQEYNKSVMFSHDIALLFVDKDFHLGEKAKRGVLVNTDKWMHDHGEIFVATGWGYTAYGGPVSMLGLMMTKLNFVPLADCIRAYNRTLLSQDMFCLYGDGKRDTCQGDSGSAVTWRGLIVGVTSHGEGCAEKNKPSIYANVWHFRHWIHNALRVFHRNFCRYLAGYNIKSTDAYLLHSCHHQKLSIDGSAVNKTEV